MSSVLPLSEIPTLTALYRLARLHPRVESRSPFTPSAELNARISFIRYDITKLGVGAIVNAANYSLRGGGGVDGAIHRAAGPGLLQECETLGCCDTGGAKITNAYRLPCKKVIHSVGPVYDLAKRVPEPDYEKSLLCGCYRASLALAHEHQCGSVAFCAISTGNYGYPSSEAAEVALGEVRRWLDESASRPLNQRPELDRIVFCCFELKDVRAYEEWLPYYFPPMPEDVPSHTSESAVITSGLLSPPQTLPSHREDPPSVAAKMHAGASPDQEWVSVEHPEFEDVNGYVDPVFDSQRSTSIGEDAMTQEQKEQNNDALHMAQLGGDPPQNALLRDW